MAGTTTYYSLPTVDATDSINGAEQITALAEATDSALNGLKGQIDEINSSGYTLPVATADTLGGVKVGTGLSVTADGTLSATAQETAIATATTVGTVKPGTGLTIAADGTLSVDISALLSQASTWGALATNGFTYIAE